MVSRAAADRLSSPRSRPIFRWSRPIFRSPENARILVTRMTFESNLTRLEQIVVRLETERLDLSASLSLFEEGVELLRKASEELNEAETRVKELVERADGALELRDFGG